MWAGDGYLCNGTAADFSLLTYLSDANIRKLPNKALENDALMQNNFAPSYTETDFELQYGFRMRSISNIFAKEFLMTFITMVILVYINVKYILNFNMTTPKAHMANISCLNNATANTTDIYWSQLAMKKTGL